MTLGSEAIQDKRDSKIEKIEQEDFVSPEYQDISFEEAVFLIAQHPKDRKELLPPGLVKELNNGKNLKELLEGKFKDFVQKGQELKEANNQLQQIAEGLLKPELMRAITSFLRNKYGLELNTKQFSEFKIVFLDIYRWVAFFLQKEYVVADANAIVLPAERIIAVRTGHRSNISLDKSGVIPADREKIKDGKLRLILLHEFLHAVSVVNYWGKEEKGGELSLIPRRFGISSARLKKVKEQDTKPAYDYLLSLKGLYEGIIETLTIAIAIDKLTSVIPTEVIEDESKKIFSGEIDVLRNLTTGVSLEYFVKAVFEKGALKDLVKKVEEVYGERYLEVIGELMKWEEKQKSVDYFLTIRFIQGHEIKVPATLFKRVNPRFVVENYPAIKLS